PWELPEKANMGRRWYFFSQKDRKYPTGIRTNRPRPPEVFHQATTSLIGMKKTLVFYMGRAPRGKDQLASSYQLHNVGVSSSMMGSAMLPMMNDHYFRNHHYQKMPTHHSH
ncbi:hypothetical protein ZWY2020_016906, partial [Hordeum vulgare]